VEPLFFELAEILAAQGKLVKEQIKASGAQNRALRQVDIQSLQAAVQKLTGLAGQMAVLDKQRVQVQSKLEQALGLEPGATLSDILPGAPAALRDKLKELQLELKQDFEQLKSLNEINGLLTRRAMQVNETLLQIIASGGGETYQHSGALKRSDRPAGVLDKTV
jgi:flagellar biosynthesis/type III secretory pathway chaperone